MPVDLHAKRRHVFAACREMGIDEETRKDLQLQATGKASSSDMNAADFDKVLAALKVKGWKPAVRGTKGKGWIDVNRADQRKVLAIWGQLAKVGVVTSGRTAINAFLCSHTFKAKWTDAATDIAIIGPERCADVIEALKDIARRNQVVLRK